jgi:type I restriction enzyme S subunit
MTLSDICDLIVDCPHSTAKDEGKGYPLIRTPNIGKGRLVLDGVHRVSQDNYNKRNVRAVPQEDDLILAREAPVGNIAIIKSDQIVCLGQRTVLIRPNKNMVDPNYLVYYLLSPSMQHILLGSSNGATVSHLNMSAIRNLEISLPKIDVQRRIGAILSELADKIEINEKINRNLEDQMQTIFGSMFYPELEVGNKVRLGDYLYIKGRIGWKGLKKDEYLDDSDFRIINGESLTDNGIDWNKAGYISEERYTESPEIMLQEEDILISKDGTIGKIGYVNILDKPTSVASGIFVVRNLKPDEVSTVFIYCLLKSNYFKRFIASRTEGSVIPHLYQKDFVTLEIPLLSEEQLRFFNEFVTPLFELYFSHNMENIKLANLRDALLPKLMSGELEVSETDV